MLRSHPFSSSLPALLALCMLPACSASDDPEPAGLGPDSPRTLEQLLDRDAPELVGVQEVWIDAEREDELGGGHARLVQTVDDIPVFGAGAVVHTDASGVVTGFTDGLVHDLDVDTTPQLSADEAVRLAVAATGGWSRLSADPQAELMVLRHGDADYLTYQVSLRHMEPGDEPALPLVFVDAHDGAVVWQYDNLTNIALNHSAYTTWDMHHGTDFGAASVGDSSDSVLDETHDSVQASLKFMYKKLSRASYDGAGSKINAYGHYSKSYVNAFWDGGADQIVLGDGDGANWGHFGVVDVVAHELGHGIVNYEAALINWGESGSLAETTGDIMGAAVTDYIGGGWVFDIGEDCWIPWDPSVAIRYMDHPSTDGSSRDHYSDRYQGNADNGGVHFNSGIGNHFFYLLSEGGQHHDPGFRSGVVVDGVGIEAATQIWYRALTVYMVPGTDFLGARAATEAAALDLYGEAERESVAAAWMEVGVGGKP